MHLIVVRTPYDVGGYLCIGGWRGIETAATGTSVVVSTDAVAKEWGDDARELDRGIGTVFIGTRLVACITLPLVGTMQVDVEFLGSPEEVTLRETNLGLRAVASIGTSDGIGFEIEVVRLVERAGQAQVECVGLRPGRKLEISTAEYACGIDLVGGFKISVVVKLLPGTKSEVPQHHTGTYGRVLAMEVDREMAALDGVRHLLTERLAEQYVYMTNIPFVQGL